MTGDITPFEIHFDDEVLADLRERLGRTRWPDQLKGAGWSYGTELSYLRELVGHWMNGFDWRAVESELNSFDNHRTDVGGIDLHFIHQRSPEATAMPLIITHGWPGSVLEFTDIIGPLTDPAAHGGQPADAFHVVCPSMPGYGLSEAPRDPGFDIKSVAETNAALMAKLGYARYGCQGGDWGAIASTLTAVVDPEHCAGIHLNMVIAGPPKEEGEKAFEGLSERELAALARVGEFMEEGTGYQGIQTTRPQSLGYGLNDSPAGLAGWIVEKFRDWSDCDGDIESRFSKDRLLANITLYWLTGSITSSTRLYCETKRSGLFKPTEIKIETPTGCAIFPKELIAAPRSWVEHHYNVVHWSEMPSGGHFAAMEEPGALVEDIRSFFRSLR